jgi:hypothetical protein
MASTENLQQLHNVLHVRQYIGTILKRSSSLVQSILSLLLSQSSAPPAATNGNGNGKTRSFETVQTLCTRRYTD